MKTLGMNLGIALLAIAWLLLSALPATATTWELAAESDQGQVRQYLDWDSVHRSGPEVSVASYYIDHRADTPRTDYVTAYACASNQFKDVEVDGQKADDDWQPLVEDPLNEAIRDLLCNSASYKQ